MSYTYADRKRAESAAPRKETAPQPSMDDLRSGAAQPTAEQMGHRVDLPDTMRAKMENAFGADLSAVKLYESQAVADTGAKAITRGSDIAFAPGMLDFSSYGGQALLGHELSHVVSQARGEVTGGGFLNDRALEARADREGAMAAAGETVAMPTAAMSPVTAAAAAGPMQAKDKPWKKGKEAAPAAPAPVEAATEPSNMPDFNEEEKAQAAGILQRNAADKQSRIDNYHAQVEKYNAAHPDAKYNASDKRRDRFLQRFMNGTDEENEELFNKVMTEGDSAMVPKFVEAIRRMNAADTSKFNTREGLFGQGEELMGASLDTQNLSDMISVDRRITPEMLEAGGLSKDEFQTYIGKKQGFATASMQTSARLKGITTGHVWSSDTFAGFDGSRPAPAQQQPSVPGQGPKETMSYRSDEIGALAADPRFDIDPTSSDPQMMAVIARRQYDKLKALQKSGADPDEIRRAVEDFKESRARQGWH